MAKKATTPATDKKATAAEVKKAETTTVKAEPVKETVEKVETAKQEEKAPAKKAAKETTKEATAKKTTAKKAEVKNALFIQFGGKSYAQEDLMKIAKDVWTYDLNQNEEELTSVELYVKPEENKVYYVMNDIAGSFDI